MIGNKIKSMRTKLGLTQQNIAEKSGVDVSTISKIESGKANPSIPTLNRIASALGVPTAELLLDTA